MKVSSPRLFSAPEPVGTGGESGDDRPRQGWVLYDSHLDVATACRHSWPWVRSRSAGWNDLVTRIEQCSPDVRPFPVHGSGKFLVRRVLHRSSPARRCSATGAPDSQLFFGANVVSRNDLLSSRAPESLPLADRSTPRTRCVRDNLAPRRRPISVEGVGFGWYPRRCAASWNGSRHGCVTASTISGNGSPRPPGRCFTRRRTDDAHQPPVRSP